MEQSRKRPTEPIELMNTNPYDALLITHNGTFHADDVMSTVIMAKYLKMEYLVQGPIFVSRVSRVPDQKTLRKGAIVYDIGFGKFDHHQGSNSYRRNGVPFAACGLLWDAYGEHFCELLGSKYPKIMAKKIDSVLIQGIDASDNGVLPDMPYPAHPLTISGVVAQFNLNWNESHTMDSQYQAFFNACQLAEQVFDNTINDVDADIKSHSIVYDAVMSSANHIAVLNQFVPWINTVYELSTGKDSMGTYSEEACEKAKDLYYVIYPSPRGGWQWRAVPVAPKSHMLRHECPKEWRGLSGPDLRSVSGIPTATFVHMNGFTGSAEMLSDALSMATIAVGE